LISIAASLALIGMAILVSLALSRGWDPFATKLIAIFNGIGALFALPFIFIGSKRVYDPSLALRFTDYDSRHVDIDGASHVVSRAKGTRTATMSRRGATILVAIGLVIYAGAALGTRAWLGADTGPGPEHHAR